MEQELSVETPDVTEQDTLVAQEAVVETPVEEAPEATESNVETVENPETV